MIRGVGTDICDIRRIRATLERRGERFAEKVLGPHELEVFRGRRARVEERGVSYLAIRRGFSFSQPAPLDMRMDRDAPLTARELVNRADPREIKRILRLYGEELQVGRIARAIVERREADPIERTDELAAIVLSAMPAHMRHGRIHPATRTFQALRIAVNDELTGLARGIASGIDSLKEGGRFSVISFHSLEDRMVKELFRDASRDCTCPPDLPVCACGV